MEELDVVVMLECLVKGLYFKGICLMIQDIVDFDWVLCLVFDWVFDVFVVIDLCFDVLVLLLYFLCFFQWFEKYLDLKCVIDYGVKLKFVIGQFDGW